MDKALFKSFKDPALVRDLLGVIEALAARLATQLTRPVSIMEVCGTHTVAIARSGFRSVLPKSVRLISGPGCPVCVTAQADIDRIIALTYLSDTIIASFGDMIRVPGSSSSLSERKAEGAAVEVIYSPLDALRLAQSHPEKQVVLVGVGFETTTPLIAATIERALGLGLVNFSVIAAHKRVPPALKELVNDSEISLDALILPGHVSTILGVAPYSFLASDFCIPCVIAGFEPVDILQGIAQLLRQILENRAEIEIAYKRAVSIEGNTAALETIDRVFEVSDGLWRGLGLIPESGYTIREHFSRFDARQRFDIAVEPTVETHGCRCGEVLRGIITPNDCGLFGRACTPAAPYGPCMVSSEGSCAAWYRYQIKD